MDRIDQIAQWVIDNRYAKHENDKLSDFGLYHDLRDKIRVYAEKCVIASLEKAAERVGVMRVDYVNRTEEVYHSVATEGVTIYANKESITNEKNIVLL